MIRVTLVMILISISIGCYVEPEGGEEYDPAFAMPLLRAIGRNEVDILYN